MPSLGFCASSRPSCFVGSMVYYEIPGKINLAKLRENGLDLDMLCRHYIYITEFLWKVSTPDENSAAAGAGNSERVWHVQRGQRDV